MPGLVSLPLIAAGLCSGFGNTGGYLEVSEKIALLCQKAAPPEGRSALARSPQLLVSAMWEIALCPPRLL
jgi:hypothetical protein